MDNVRLKLKQASAVLGVNPKELQNLVQFGVLRPRKRADIFWFDFSLLLQAKIAFHVKQSLATSTDYLVRLTKQLSRIDLSGRGPETLSLSSSPASGAPPIEIRIPLGQLKKELEANLPAAEIVRDLPRGRKRAGWKEEFKKVLLEAGNDVGAISEAEILKGLRDYRRTRKKQPEIRVVTQVRKSA